MKKLSVVIFIILLLVMGCSTPTPELVDVHATVDMAIQMTNAAISSATPTIAPTNTKEPTNIPEPTNTPAPTNTPKPTNTPNPNDIASDFIYYFKDNFQFYAKKLTPKIEVELVRFDFEYDNESNLNLMFETKSGEVLIQNKTVFNYSLAMLATDLEKDRPLPKEINEVWFTFRNNDDEVREQYILDWDVLIDYVENDITEDQLLGSLRTP